MAVVEPDTLNHQVPAVLSRHAVREPEPKDQAPVFGNASNAQLATRGPHLLLIWSTSHPQTERTLVPLLKLWVEPKPAPTPDSRTAGAVDTGIKPSATDSGGQAYQNPSAYYATERKLKRWQHAQARRIKGSRGWLEAQRRIDRCHRRIRGIRHNAIHQMTRTLTKK